MIASSLGRESSLESDDWQNGAFTQELLAALVDGVADLDGDGSVSVRELQQHVSRAVPKLTENRQHPVLHSDNVHGAMSLPIAPR